MPPLLRPRHPALPQVPGPKLAPFTPTAHAQIKFICDLGRSNDQDALVWKVEIDGKHYALKMFKFKSLGYLRARPARYLRRPLAERRLYFDYFDPFNCECRVYGRLKAERREDLAVKAHGYLLLSPQQEAEMTNMVNSRRNRLVDPDSESDGDDNDIWDRLKEHGGQPVRAIVKDLVSNRIAFDIAQIPSIWTDLKGLHSLGILVRDIHAGNYLGGKLVDFSLAWTMYHPCLVHIDLYDISSFKRLEAHDLEIMFDSEYPLDDYDVPEDMQKAAGDETCGVDPRSFDWIGKGGEEVVRHVVKELYADTKTAK